MKDFKELSLFLIPYLFICSGLYHVAFWDTFDINGLAYIGVTDLIKSFIYPFLTFGLSFFVGLITTELIFRIDDWFPSNQTNNTNPDTNTTVRHNKLRQAVNSKPGLFIVTILWMFLVIFLYRYGQSTRWLIWGMVVSVTPFLLLDKAGLFKNLFSNNSLRQFVIRILIYIPAFSFAAGKYESEMIYKNVKYKYITKAVIEPMSISFTIDTIKLIGIADQYLFMTDLNNSKILLIRSDNIDTLRLQQH